MKTVVVQKYNEQNLIVQNNDIFGYMAGNGEVLSGGGPPSIDKYIDLNAEGIGHEGTELDPYSAIDWQALLSPGLYQSYRFYTKGSYLDDTGTSKLNFNSSGSIVQYYLPWNPIVNGPYRFRLSAVSTSYVSLKGGILFLDGAGPLIDIVSSCHQLLNMYIKCGIFKSANAKGCLIDCTTFDPDPIGIPGGLDYYDNAVKAINYGVGAVYSTHYNCAFNDIISFTNVNCQQDWIPPTLPEWNAAKEVFAVNLLYLDIDTPPQPGTTPYTEYESDLWGNARNGIGAGYVDSRTEFYVDLSTEEGEGYGTEIEPYTFPQLIYRLVNGIGHDGDKYFLRGITPDSYDDVDWGEAYDEYTLHFCPWSTDDYGTHKFPDKKYGPWIWKAKASLRSCICWSGIIYSDQFDINISSAYNCYISAMVEHNLILTTSSAGYPVIQGCTVIFDAGNITIQTSPIWGVVSYLDSSETLWTTISSGGVVIDNITVNSRHSTFKAEDETWFVPSGTFNPWEGDNQFGWIPPSEMPFTVIGGDLYTRGWKESIYDIIQDKTFMTQPEGITSIIGTDITDIKQGMFGSPREDGRSDERTYPSTGIGCFWFRQDGLQLNDLASSSNVCFKDRGNSGFQIISTLNKYGYASIYGSHSLTSPAGWEREGAPLVEVIPIIDAVFSHKVINFSTLLWINIKSLKVGNPFSIVAVSNNPSTDGILEAGIIIISETSTEFEAALYITDQQSESFTILKDNSWHLISINIDANSTPVFYFDLTNIALESGESGQCNVILAGDILGGPLGILHVFTMNMEVDSIQYHVRATQARTSVKRALLQSEVENVYTSELISLPTLM